MNARTGLIFALVIAMVFLTSVVMVHRQRINSLELKLQAVELSIDSHNHRFNKLEQPELIKPFSQPLNKKGEQR